MSSDGQAPAGPDLTPPGAVPPPAAEAGSGPPPGRRGLRRLVAAVLLAALSGTGAWIWRTGDPRETVVHRVGGEGAWGLACVRVSALWSRVLSLPRVSGWLGDPGYEGERWWMVSPSGTRLFWIGLNGVTAGKSDPDPAATLTTAANLIPSWGFSSLGFGVDFGAWQPHRSRVPAVATLPLPAWGAGLSQDVFNAAHEQGVERACDSVASSLRGADPPVGLVWELASDATPRGLLLAYAARDPGSPSKQALVEHLKLRCAGDIGQLQARMPSLRDFGDLLASREWSQYENIDADAAPFAARVIGEYAARVRKAARDRWPEVLNFGPVLPVGAPPEVWQALAAHVDAVAVSIRPDDGRLPRRALEEIHRVTGRPVVIMDTGCRPGLRTAEGIAAAYRRTVTAAASLPFVVGCAWTGYRDAEGAAGFVDEGGAPRPALVRAATEVNAGLDARHLAGAEDGDLRGLYREHRFDGGPPAQAVGRLTVPLVVDGDVSDWPGTSHELNPLTSTRDLDPVALGKVLVGWNAEGLALAVEVADDAPDVLDPRIYWRGADFVEVFVDASAVRGDRYVRESLHLAVVPAGGSPAVIAVHHPGDGMPGTIYPFEPVSAAVKAPAGARLWRLEILIPWTLVGVSPVAGQRLGFNLILRRHDAGGHEDAFWARPRGEAGVDHPNSWGELTLAEAAS